MAYTINKTDGSIFATVSDGTINTDTSITIIGKNYAGYGEFLGENFLRMLENNANATPPTNPLSGQLWYDAVTGLLKVYNGSIFRNLGASTAQGTEPASNIVGDTWFDTVNAQLNVYDGANFILVGPAFTAGSGTSGSQVDTITDNIAVDHIVLNMFVNDEIVAIISKDAEFTPALPITGFAATIKPGIQMALTIAGQFPKFVGDATNAELLDGINSTGFLSSLLDDSTIGTLGILNDNGLTVGADNDGRFRVTGSTVVVANVSIDGDLLMQVNDGGIPTTVITCDGASSRARVSTPVNILDITNKDYVDTAVGGLAGNALQRDGSNDITGVVKPAVDATTDLGAALNQFNTVHAVTFSGQATTAQYADLAERFHADSYYEPGTVVQLGGVEEITKAATDLSDDVFGVISTNAAFLMNAGAGNNETHPAVAMSGRVPVRVIGKVAYGERLVSAGNGLARAALQSEMTSFNVIGRALESKTTEAEGVIEAFVTVN